MLVVDHAPEAASMFDGVGLLKRLPAAWHSLPFSGGLEQ